MGRGYEDINYYEELRQRIDRENKEREEKQHIDYNCYLCGAEGANFFHYENGNIIVKCVDCIRKENDKRLEDMSNEINEYKED